METGLSPAQVLIQWNQRHGVAVATKCSSVEHVHQALAASPPAAPPLTATQMQLLDAIHTSQGGKLRVVCPPWMGANVPLVYRFD